MQIPWNGTNLQIWFTHFFIYLWPVISVIKREVLIIQDFPGGSVANNPPVMQETWVWFLGWEGSLEKGMTTHSSRDGSCSSTTGELATSVFGEGQHCSTAHNSPDRWWEGSGICAGSPRKYLVTFKYSSDCCVWLWKNIQVMDCNKCAH